jgi:hypothetical protein
MIHVLPSYAERVMPITVSECTSDDLLYLIRDRGKKSQSQSSNSASSICAGTGGRPKYILYLLIVS